MTEAETELLAEYALLEALIAEEKAEEALRRPRGRTIQTGYQSHQHSEFSNYVLKAGDTMTGPLVLSEAGNSLTLDPNDPTATQPSIHFKSAADNADIWSDGDGINFGSISLGALPFFIIGSTNTCCFPGFFGSGIVFDNDSLWDIAESTVRPANIYTDVLNIGSGAAGIHLAFRSDSQTDFGSTASRARCIYTDTLNLGSGAAGEHLLLRTDDQSDIGNATRELRNIYVDGTAYIDELRSDVNLDIDGAIDVSGIDVAGGGAGAFQRAIPVTYSGGTGYIYIYNAA